MQSEFWTYVKLYWFTWCTKKIQEKEETILPCLVPLVHLLFDFLWSFLCDIDAGKEHQIWLTSMAICKMGPSENIFLIACVFTGREELLLACSKETRQSRQYALMKVQPLPSDLEALHDQYIYQEVWLVSTAGKFQKRIRVHNWRKGGEGETLVIWNVIITWEYPNEELPSVVHQGCRISLGSVRHEIQNLQSSPPLQWGEFHAP